MNDQLIAEGQGCPKCGTELIPLPAVFVGFCEACGERKGPETLDDALECLARAKGMDSNSPAFIAWWHTITKGYMTADEFLASL